VSFGFQKFDQFGAGHEQLATHCPAHFQFAPLDEAVNAEIIDAQEIGGFLHGVGQSFRWGGGWWLRLGYGIHNHSISTFGLNLMQRAARTQNGQTSSAYRAEAGKKMRSI
jgi:hypothetical protein